MPRKKNRIADTSFYVVRELIGDDALVLEGDNFHHATRVLRQREGSTLAVVDGYGVHYTVSIERIDSARALCSIVDRRPEDRRGMPPVVLGVGMIRSRDRFETIVEKAVELGVTKIVPLATARSTERTVRRNRLLRIAEAAMKQSGRARLAEIPEPATMSAFVDSANKSLRLFCSQDSRDSRLGDVLAGSDNGREIVIAVGPEGGFEDNETDLLIASGFTGVSLGSHRLRTETAAICAMALIGHHYTAGR